MKPKIRFKGFDGEWEESPFSKIVERISTSAQAGKLPGIEFEDIVSGEGRLNKDIYQKVCCKYGNLFREGDILFGKLRPYLKNILLADFKGVAIGDFWILRSKENDSKYLYTLVNSNSFMKIANISSGSKMPRADWNLVSSTKFAIPSSMDEQRTIGEYFTSLDAQISACASRLASLKQIKAASLQAMFPKEGETMPKVRFKGFKGEWKKFLVGNLGKTYSGLSGKCKDDFGFGNAHYITFLNVLTNAHIDTSILEHVDVKDGEGQNAVKKGDLFFNTSSETPEEVGMCAVLDEDVENVYLNSFCFGFRITHEKMCPAFFAYLMRSNTGRHIMSILAQGATRYNLSKASFCNTELLLPTDLEEQQKIASYFTSLDRQITLHSQRLEKLKQIKAACLDKMFV